MKINAKDGKKRPPAEDGQEGDLKTALCQRKGTNAPCGARRYLHPRLNERVLIPLSHLRSFLCLLTFFFICETSLQWQPMSTCRCNIKRNKPTRGRLL